MTSEFSIVATVRKGHTIAEVEAAIAEEIDRIKAEPPSAEEMERAVNTFEARLVRSMESVNEFGGRGDRLNLYNTYTGDPGYMAKDFARYGQVDAAQVTQMAKRYLGAGRVVVEVVPGSEVDHRAESARGRRRGPREDGQGSAGIARLFAKSCRGGEPAASRCRRAAAEPNSACRRSNGRRFPTACNCCWWKSTSCRWST